VFARVAEAQAAARAALAAVPGVTLLTPPGRHAGLVTFTIEGREPEAAARRLAERGVVVRWLRRPAALRASLGFFTDAADVSRLASACAGVAAGDGC
jgi:selenocysteine lyase/cysteine desulfurase